MRSSASPRDFTRRHGKLGPNVWVLAPGTPSSWADLAPRRSGRLACFSQNKSLQIRQRPAPSSLDDLSTGNMGSFSFRNLRNGSRGVYILSLVRLQGWGRSGGGVFASSTFQVLRAAGSSLDPRPGNLRLDSSTASARHLPASLS